MAYTVKLESTGHTIEVEADQTILDAALHHGVDLPYGCRHGACGKCKGRIVSGEVDYGEYQEHALPEPERRAGMVLLCQAKPQSDLVLEGAEMDDGRQPEVRRLPARVHDARKLTHDIMEVRLKLPEQERLQYLAGQYVEVILKDGRRRAFSIANSPIDDQFLTLHIRHVPGGAFTDHVFEGLQKGEIWTIEGPLGQFYLRHSERPAVLVAGGTGLGPIRAILEKAFEEGERRPLRLFFGVRSGADVYGLEELERWAAEHDNFQYTVALSDPAEEDAGLGYEQGYVHEVIPGHCEDLTGWEGYLAGPPPMVEAGRHTLISLGADPEAVYADAFTYSSN
jgi:CDP-4-dehydro-6-deoxyglucose reductase